MTQSQPENTSADFGKVIESFRSDYARIVEQVSTVIVGMEEVVNQTLACLLGGGHALLEGVPGLGKTLLVRTLGQTLDLTFSRIQFTPDLMPADITGTNIVVADDRGGRAFEFQRGPIFANLILADEINRATPKTQSAVLEAMQEQTVSVARTTYALDGPFFVLATQNPLEMEGTYPLPEAQLDRFLFKINVGSPTQDHLVTIMDRTTGTAAPKPAKVASAARIEEMKAAARQVNAATHVKEYIANLVLATHPSASTAPPEVKKYVRYGSSPRGAQAMLLAAKVAAIRGGRANVAFADIRAAALPALRHRLILSFEGQADGVEPDQIIRKVLEAVPSTKTA
ncbi:MAG: AAA family ATPase [Phycisphaerae bacterium]